MVFDYIDGAAGSEKGEALNRAALDAIRLMPRALRDMRDINISRDVFDKKAHLPFGICPMGMCNAAHPQTDSALAKIARGYNIPFGISTISTTPMERLLEMSEGNAWFQLYYSGDGSGSLKLVERALRAGFETLILTVDVPTVGTRPREAKHKMAFPMRYTPRVIYDCATHPKWSLSQLLSGAPKAANFDGKDFIFNRFESRAGADLNFFKKLRDLWKGKLVVKGVMDGEDAHSIRDAGADAIWVSSHGCRQLDAAPPAIEQLQIIRQSFGKDYPLFFDSGIRSGEDILRAYKNGG